MNIASAKNMLLSVKSSDFSVCVIMCNLAFIRNTVHAYMHACIEILSLFVSTHTIVCRAILLDFKRHVNHFVISHRIFSPKYASKLSIDVEMRIS